MGKGQLEAVCWVHNERKAIVSMGFIGLRGGGRLTTLQCGPLHSDAQGSLFYAYETMFSFNKT